jgi:glycine cleavage system regulatory protein
LLFEARARLAASTEVDRDVIQANLEAIAQDLMVDIRWLD